MPQTQIKLGGPSQSPKGIFFQETYKSMYRKVKSQEFFIEIVKKIYMEKPTTKNRKGHKLFFLKTSGCYGTKVIKKYYIRLEVGILTNKTEKSSR